MMDRGVVVVAVVRRGRSNEWQGTSNGKRERNWQ
jgi:hypothetical protein